MRFFFLDVQLADKRLGGKETTPWGTRAFPRGGVWASDVFLYSTGPVKPDRPVALSDHYLRHLALVGGQPE
jgi:hypothetical protein